MAMVNEADLLPADDPLFAEQWKVTPQGFRALRPPWSLTSVLQRKKDQEPTAKVPQA